MTPKPKKRGKNYPPPLVPSTVRPALQLLPAAETFTSEDEEEPPHSNIPLSQRRKKGYVTNISASVKRKKNATSIARGTKAERDILNDTENPRPSTSAALMREMTRILNSVKNGTIPKLSRSRDSQSQSRTSVEKSISTPNSNSNSKRSPVVRKLSLPQLSKKKKVVAKDKEKVPNPSHPVQQSVRKDVRIFDFPSDSPDPESLPTNTNHKKSVDKRPIPVIHISSSEDEAEKSMNESGSTQVNGKQSEIPISNRNGKRKPETADAENSDPLSQGDAKKLKAGDFPNTGTGDTATGTEVKSELNGSGLNRNGVNGHENDNDKEVEKASEVKLKTPSQPRFKKQTKAKKLNTKVTEKFPDSSKEDKELTSKSTQVTTPQSNGVMTNGNGTKSKVTAPTITIKAVSGISSLPARRSSRERRPRHIDNAWIY